jgi:hypothetical protein
MTGSDYTRVESLAPWIRATLDEYARATRDLEAVVLSISDVQYTKGSSLSDEEFPHLMAIMEHVAGAGNRYVDYLECAMTGEDVTRRTHDYSVSTPSEAMKSVWNALGRTEEVMKLTIGQTDEQLSKYEVLTRWKQTYDIEQMLEHAIVHILRHRRQVERWLALM